jgi:hypothetical protein
MNTKGGGRKEGREGAGREGKKRKKEPSLEK